ncbi:hypothetical protein SHEWT2_04107 [Shewanella hafniensis]|nr:hypothetical protein SHEWT2_04107 [Shewanella hafniensis]
MKFFNTFFKNILGLGSLNLVNLIIPIMLIPFLSRLMGEEDYGYVMYITTVQLFIALFLDYSFNVTSVKEYVQESDVYKKRLILIETQFSRLILAIFAIILLYFYTLLSNGSVKDLLYYVLPFVIGHFLISPWYHQAESKLLLMGLILVLSRCLHLAIVLFFSDDSYAQSIVLSSQTYTYLLAGIVLNFKSFKSYSYNCLNVTYFINLLFCSLIRIKKSFLLFLADFSPNLYTNIPTILLADMISKTSYFQYNIAVKIIGVGLMIQTIVAKSLFPILCKNDDAKQKIVFIINFFPTILFIMPMLYYSDEIYNIITGAQSEIFHVYIKIMSVGMIFGVLGNYLGQNYILIKTNGSGYSKIVIFSCLLTGAIGLFIVPYYKDLGAAFLLTIGRFFFFVGCVYFFINYKRQKIDA